MLNKRETNMTNDPSSSSSPPTGPWSGYYLYSPSDAPHGMKLHLTFARDGNISGDGIDDIADFFIHGVFDPGTLEACWTKSYVGSHSVEYHGFYDGRTIWGTWSLAGRTGGFRIWPGTVAPGEEEAVHAETEQPAETVLVV